ncbi:tail protein X [Algimonas porphyrae]|uniref:Phage tail protein n=1 Tax=Algimonas porphyrae TaxID=1128113 RepID=A0ABQ5UZG8_9PROT|nr:tail protein X [Algimonas porphyrae]GLQ20518.1 hypothetical protein GCM10007854_14730 [Algimonas porphyrae]
MTYRTVEGDVLDRIVHDHYGQTVGRVEAVLDANPVLRDQPPILPAGLIISLPSFTPVVADSRVRLWS